MKFLRCFIIIVLTVNLIPQLSSAQQQKKLVVKLNQVKGNISAAMWGVFFEDINMGADGGIYAELIKNRSFEFSKPFMGWKIERKKFVEGDILVVNRKEAASSNPRFIRVKAANAVKGDLGITNEGFRGMGITKDVRYDFSVQYRQQKPGVRLLIELINESGNKIGGATLALPESGDNWHKAAISFTATETAFKAKMNCWFEGDGEADLDMISLFPGNTWKNRPGGMRADMIQLLANMKPGFIRFPGGCIVEGFDLNNRYQWKKTIGPIEERQLIVNRWNMEFAHRSTPDYFQTFGLGFFEYFQLSEDIGAEPLPILNCGMACQFNSAEIVSLNELDPYVQDALDLIEFANGNTTTQWGKVRAGLGHPEPFYLKMIGIGNENWGPQYVERLKVFKKAIKEKYPDIKLVYSSGTGPDGERFEYLDSTLRGINADIIDEHYYRKPEWFLQNAARYDNYDRKGPRIFAGEYAAHSDKSISPENKNIWYAALTEAAYMTGLERNADIVQMASYAPLFAHADGWQWTPDLIWVNNLQSYGTPSYYVQTLFSVNKGHKIISITADNESLSGKDSLYASACIDTVTNQLIVKLVNVSGKEITNNIAIEGMKKGSYSGTSVVLKGIPAAMNTFDQQPVLPLETAMKINPRNMDILAEPYSFTVIKVNLK